MVILKWDASAYNNNKRIKTMIKMTKMTEIIEGTEMIEIAKMIGFLKLTMTLQTQVTLILRDVTNLGIDKAESSVDTRLGHTHAMLIVKLKLGLDVWKH